MAVTKDEVFKKVQAALVDALGVDEEEVTPQATMVGDLGAESIDCLDIVFKLEKSFAIEIPRKELTPEDILTSAEYVQDGKVTAAGLAELKRRMPFVDFSTFEADPQIRNFSNLLTVGALCRYIESKVGAS
jgi:acyl carrier protein